MTEAFDAYHELLGIPPHEQPPNHYRLLGITLFEANRQVVGNAAMQRSKFLRSLGISQYAEVCQRLLNEIATAKLCLLDETKKAAYDRGLCGPSPPIPADVSPRPVSRPAPPTTIREASHVSDDDSPAAAHGAAVAPLADERRDEATVRDWIVGRAPNCDIVVDAPAVSGIHCRLSKLSNGSYHLEDLHSTNHTYVNRVPISGKVRVRPSDQITLGKTTPLPWPADADRRR